MSIKLLPNAARLTVLGSGWSSTAIESGDGFTENGDLMEDIAGDLGYDFGDDVDWDNIAGDADIDWSDIIYTDSNGNIYDDLDGDGVWTDANGNEYTGGGDRWVSDTVLIDLSNTLLGIAQTDADLVRYSIPNDVLPTLYGGKVSAETNPTQSGSDRPHTFTPAVYYIQTSSNNAITFLGEPFAHGTASGGGVTVNDDAITIRDGSSKAVYWSSCTTHFSDDYLPSPYSSYPIQYVCWQCLHGSLRDALIATSDNTITREDIENGTTGLQTVTYNGKTFYGVSGKF